MNIYCNLVPLCPVCLGSVTQWLPSPSNHTLILTVELNDAVIRCCAASRALWLCAAIDAAENVHSCKVSSVVCAHSVLSGLCHTTVIAIETEQRRRAWLLVRAYLKRQLLRGRAPVEVAGEETINKNHRRCRIIMSCDCKTVRTIETETKLKNIVSKQFWNCFFSSFVSLSFQLCGQSNANSQAGARDCERKGLFYCMRQIDLR